MFVFVAQCCQMQKKKKKPTHFYANFALFFVYFSCCTDHLGLIVCFTMQRNMHFLVFYFFKFLLILSAFTGNNFFGTSFFRFTNYWDQQSLLFIGKKKLVLTLKVFSLIYDTNLMICLFAFYANNFGRLKYFSTI